VRCPLFQARSLFRSARVVSLLKRCGAGGRTRPSLFLWMRNSVLTKNFPPTLLILGTDMAGKDHLANIVADAAQSAGVVLERRRGAFSGRPTRQQTSEDKGSFSLWLEWAFITALPLHCRFLPVLTALLILWDLRRFRRPAHGSVLVVSHTAIRLLAFALGHLFARIEDIRIPALTEQALRAIVPATGARTVVLDIDHEVRAKRLAQRLNRGALDHFDRYMGQDPLRSERIEAFLVWLGLTYLEAVRIENNNVTDAELLAAMDG